jgi:hypothetical protein
MDREKQRNEDSLLKQSVCVSVLVKLHFYALNMFKHPRWLLVLRLCLCMWPACDHYKARLRKEIDSLKWLYSVLNTTIDILEMLLNRLDIYVKLPRQNVSRISFCSGNNRLHTGKGKLPRQNVSWISFCSGNNRLHTGNGTEQNGYLCKVATAERILNLILFRQQ